jgi:hypothetical protein
MAMRTRAEVEVGICRFMVYLMAHRAIRSPVNTYVQKGKVAVSLSPWWIECSGGEASPWTCLMYLAKWQKCHPHTGTTTGAYGLPGQVLSPAFSKWLLCFLPASCCFLTRQIVHPGRWRWCVPPKCSADYTTLYPRRKDSYIRLVCWNVSWNFRKWFFYCIYNMKFQVLCGSWVIFICITFHKKYGIGNLIESLAFGNICWSSFMPSSYSPVFK